ncbi:hypothetical protein BJ742DRAFT_818806 [Cladochytrium replicatum]|nr:hypothetical protein BJ742DRAFT_818806 [Cladochytrium replicatum]
MSVKSPVTTHVLDTTNGCAAAGVAVLLHYAEKSENALDSTAWSLVGSGQTDQDGRCGALLLSENGSRKPGYEAGARPGLYKLTFLTGAYFEKKGLSPFFPYAEIVFKVKDVPDHHYHVPVIINPYSYSTYRGT